jgi:two-component system chemotaxis response regulator CheB
MGRDGVAGAAALVAAGGEICAQDEESSVIWGMPGAVVAAGLATASLSPRQIARRIGERAGRAPSP